MKGMKSRVTRFKTFIDNYEDTDEYRLVLQDRLEKYDELWQEFHVIQTKIDSTFPEANIVERERFEETFFAVQTVARSKLTRFKLDESESSR